MIKSHFSNYFATKIPLTYNFDFSHEIRYSIKWPRVIERIKPLSTQILFITEQGRAFKVDFARLYISVMVAFLFLLAGRFDPDYESYRILYDSAGGWLAAQARDPIFVYVISKANALLSYENFRYTLCGIFGVALFRLTTGIGVIGKREFDLVPAIFLTPFILLKLHVQIREGAALLLWFFAIACECGMPAARKKTWRFWILAGFSCAIHLSTIIWWSATLFLQNKNIQPRHQAFIIFILFAFFGTATTTIGREFITDYIFPEYFFVRASQFYTTVSIGKIIYWSLFTIFPIFTILLFRHESLYLKTETQSQPSVLGFIATFGTIGFFLPSLICVWLWGTTEGDFSHSLRIANTLIMLLCIHLSHTYPKHPFSWMVFSFSLMDATRLLMQ